MTYICMKSDFAPTSFSNYKILKKRKFERIKRKFRKYKESMLKERYIKLKTCRLVKASNGKCIKCYNFSF